MEDFAPKYGKYAFTLLALLVIAGSLFIVSPFFPALMWATVLSVLVYPTHKKLKKKMPDWASALTTTLLTIAIVGIPMILIGVLLYLQIISYARDFTAANPTPATGWTVDAVVVEIDHHIKPLLTEIGATNFKLVEWWAENKSTVGSRLGQTSVGFLQTGFYTLFTLVIAFLTMFFALKDGHHLREPVLELIPLPRAKSEEILDRMQKTIQAVFVGVVLVAFIQGSLAGLAYWIAGVPSPLVWTVATMVLCVVPLLGAPFIYVPLSLILISQGKTWEGVGLGAFGFLIVSNADNVLRPFIIGTRVQLHPMAIFFSLLGGVLALGPVGIMMGPVLLTLLLAIQEIIRERIRHEKAVGADENAEIPESVT